MPMRRPCRSSARLGAVLAILALTVEATAAQPTAHAPQSAPDARSATQAEGAAAMERLKAAITAQQNTQEPSTFPAPNMPNMPEATRRRAFDGLHRRVANPAMEARARAAASKGQTDLAAQREAMAKRIGQALGLEAPDRVVLAGSAPRPGDSSRVPVIFASSSMPIGELRAYAAQLEKAGGVIAFRGMPGGMTRVAPMASLTARILRLDPGCEGPACEMRKVQVIVDPLIFRQHGVTRVPALTLVPGDPTQPYCERDDDSPRGSQIVYGDAALTGLLEEYARLGGKEEVRDVQARLGQLDRQ